MGYGEFRQWLICCYLGSLCLFMIRRLWDLGLGGAQDVSHLHVRPLSEQFSKQLLCNLKV